MRATDAKTGHAGAETSVHTFCIAHDHPALPGHFPGNPVVPGVVLLEQVVMLLEAAHGPMTALRLPQVKFLHPLLPGQEARVEMTPRTATNWRFHVVRGETLLASGDIATIGSAR